MFVNCGGPRAKGFLGCSGVAAPLKGRVGGTSGCEEEVTVVEVDLDVLIVSDCCVLRPFFVFVVVVVVVLSAVV